MKRGALYVLALSGCVCWSSAAQADVFVLTTGGQVRGELLNKEESPRKTYQIKTPAGGMLAVESDQVKEVVRQSEAEIKYDQIRSRFADTVAGQWEAAQWCRTHRLVPQRKAHLERIVELDPDHADARRALGFVKIQGRWTTQNEHMQASGMVRYKGSWRYPQEVELLERQQKEKAAQDEWMKRLKRWSGWLESEKADEALRNIAAIEDPYAVKALSMHLSRAKLRRVKPPYIDALARIGTPAAMDTLVECSIGDPDEEIRLLCLERIAARKYTPATKKYVQALKSKRNSIVNLAAAALAQMKDQATVGPLIDALVTKHKVTLRKEDPRRINSTFSNDPNGGGGGFGDGGFTFGSSTKIVELPFYNRDVLDALVGLTGQNFAFDVKDWKVWFAAQKKPQKLDNARRDST